jgi:predicted TIM-barrel fold metal-dependent hydrolase
MSTGETITRRNWLSHAAASLAVAGPYVWESATMAASAKVLRIVDSNVHVWKSDPRYPWAADLKDPPKQDAVPSALLELMRTHGVDQTVIVHVIYYRWDCRYAAACVREHRDKFLGVCRVDPESPTAAAEVDHWVAEGLRGVRLSPGPGPAGDWIGDRRQMDLICGRSAALGVPLCVLCSTSRLPDLEQVIERHRDRLDVCIDHMAECPIDRPEELKKLLALARYKRVFVKLSHLWSLSRQEYPYRDTHEQVRRLYDAFGPERLMWGTDWPVVEQYCGYGRALALFRDEVKFFTDEDRRWILGGTALRLWPSGQSG